MTYPTVDSQPSFPALETDVLARWETDDTFRRSVARRDAGINGSNEFVFYDGPPFANGLPHYGHLLTSYVKDAVPRYQTMKGRRVERRFGWDCHGLPAEVEAERRLGLKTRKDILELGVAEFNAVCRSSVLEYTQEWETYVDRAARWVDFRNDYKTLDLSYMESVMWAFKTLFDKGLIYEGFKVLPYCWRCETPLSNTETRMDDVYRQRQDPALTVAFLLDNGDKILAWTTTPWTLPANLALAVGPEITYAIVARDGERLILAESRLAAYEKELDGFTVVATMPGSELVGRRYIPLFDFLADQPDAFRVLSADFVSTEDGTGVVHLAPGFGEDDQMVCNAAGIATVVPMDSAGCYTAEIKPWFGVHVFEANPLVIRALKANGVVIRHETYDHPYPHCWRCNQPLVYKAVSSWFVEVTKFRDRMVELNADITWVPAHVKEGSFGKWIANARDWSISRNRFWGSPIPVWRSDNPDFPRTDVYGSLDDIERDFGVRPTDLHRPFVDDLIRQNPDDPSGSSMMRRVPEVLDCWFESGSMPFAQVHYPFENRDWFEQHYPGDFIVEYLAQTRGWFYTLHVLATALFDRPAFRSCVSHGVVLGNDGAKMSKSLRNYPDPYEMFNTYGSDAMRWFLLSSTILRGTDLSVTEQGIRESVRQSILPMWNAWYFFSLYANADRIVGHIRHDQPNVLDQYILAKADALVHDVTTSMDVYDMFAACGAIREFLDALNNWYIRRSRDRFWNGDQDAFDTLYTVLDTVTRVSAPLLPLVSEAIYGGMHDGESVHLTDWPLVRNVERGSDLVTSMDRVREVCSSALSVRKIQQLRVRLPLAELVYADVDAESLAPYVSLIMDELNVKSVRLVTDVATAGAQVLQVSPKELGPRLGKDVQRVIKAVKASDWSIVGDSVMAGGVELLPGEFDLKLVPLHPERSAALPGNAGVVVLDTVVTPELEREGRARDLVRMIQQARRDAGLNVSDRVALTVSASPDWLEALSYFESFVAAETLSTSVATALSDGDPIIAVARV